jgi:hypothetical protein
MKPLPRLEFLFRPLRGPVRRAMAPNNVIERPDSDRFVPLGDVVALTKRDGPSNKADGGSVTGFAYKESDPGFLPRQPGSDDGL